MTPPFGFAINQPAPDNCAVLCKSKCSPAAGASAQELVTALTSITRTHVSHERSEYQLFLKNLTEQYWDQ